MKLTKCKDCGHEISKKADKCPNCGAPNKSGSRQFGLGKFLVLLIFGAFIYSLFTGTDTGGTSSASKNKSGGHDESYLTARACGVAQDAVRERLKAPSTAEFPSCGFGLSEYEIRASDDRSLWYVLGHVDAQNSYGAQIRNEFGVKMTQEDDQWTVKSVAIE